MARKKAVAKPKRLVWRMTDGAPMGEWVDPDLPSTPAPKKDLPEVSSGSWVVSSFDLLNGIDMTEGPNTVPDDLFDELFPAPPKRDPKSPAR